MQINSYNPQIAFGEKYQVDRLISCACNKPFITKSDSVNLITSILKLTKDEKKEMMHHDDIFRILMKKAGDYILTQVPELKLFVDLINNTNAPFREKLIQKAETQLGEELNVKRLIRNRETRKDKSWIFKDETP